MSSANSNYGIIGKTLREGQGASVLYQAHDIANQGNTALGNDHMSVYGKRQLSYSLEQRMTIGSPGKSGNSMCVCNRRACVDNLADVVNWHMTRYDICQFCKFRVEKQWLVGNDIFTLNFKL